MLVIECNECGAPLQAAEQAELIRSLADHLKTDHGIDADQAELTELVASEAYEATDS